MGKVHSCIPRSTIRPKSTVHGPFAYNRKNRTYRKYFVEVYVYNMYTVDLSRLQLHWIDRALQCVTDRS